MELEIANKIYEDVSEALKDYGVLDRKNALMTKSWGLDNHSEKETYFEIPVDFFGLGPELSTLEYMKNFDLIEKKITPLIDEIIVSYSKKGSWTGTWAIKKFIRPHIAFYSFNTFNDESKTDGKIKKTNIVSYFLSKKKETMGLISSFLAMSFLILEICK